MVIMVALSGHRPVEVFRRLIKGDEGEAAGRAVTTAHAATRTLAGRLARTVTPGHDVRTGSVTPGTPACATCHSGSYGLNKVWC
jgi:hypothetical protein